MTGPEDPPADESCVLITPREESALGAVVKAADALRACFELGPKDWDYYGMPPGRDVVAAFKVYDAARAHLKKVTNAT